MKIRIDAPGITYGSTLFLGGVEKKLVCKDGVVETNDTVLAEHLLNTQVGSEIIEQSNEPEPIPETIPEPEEANVLPSESKPKQKKKKE